MSSISCALKGLVSIPVNILNQPVVKEGVKNVAGIATFFFGLIECADLVQVWQGRKISTEASTDSSDEIKCSKFSLVLSGAVSRPGVYLISSLVGRVFSTSQLERAFGPNINFANNTCHPRHVVSFFAVILALPSVAKSTYEGCYWVYRKVVQEPKTIDSDNADCWISDYKVPLMTLFNTVTSRPVLHSGNLLLRRFRSI